MAISFGSVSYTTSSTSTLSHTVGSGSKRILCAVVTVSDSQTVSGVTYGGVAMTLLTNTAVFGATNSTSYLYYLVAPAVGTANIVATVSGTPSVTMAAASYKGVEQASPITTSATNKVDSGNPISASVTSSAASNWIVAAGAQVPYSGTKLRSFSQTVVTTETARVPSGVSGNWSLWGDSNGQIGSATSVQSTFTSSSGSHEWGLIVFNLTAESSLSVSCASMNLSR